MKKLLLLFLFISLYTVQSATAQSLSADETLKEVNKVKLDGSYIWAEGTSRKNEKDALANALAVLNYEVQIWVKSQGTKDMAGIVMPTNDQCMKIQTKRGSLYRTFVYVEKNSIMPYYKNEKIVVVESPMGESKEETKEETLISSYEPIYEPSLFEKEMLEIRKSSDMGAFIKKHGITRHGKYKERPQEGIYYLFVYNQKGEVPVCLKYTDGVLINVATGKEDTFDNYKGCGAHWFFENK